MPLNKELTAMPSMTPLLAKAAFTRNSGKKELPAMTRSLRNIEIDAEHLKAYNRVCGFKDRAVLPPTYLFICAQPLCMDMMLDDLFPFKVVGLVHVRNSITQHRPVRCSERYDLLSRMENLQEVEKGYELDIVTEASIDGEIVWSCVMTSIVRAKTSIEPSKEKKQIVEMDWTDWDCQTFDSPADIGRRYAKASGDYNPIHLYPWTAKILGFPKAIAHGMWMKAKISSILAAEYENEKSFTINVNFKLPNLLPAKLNMYTQNTDGAMQVWLRTKKGDKPIVQASIVTHL